ncbi:MAG: PEGA domain-containing protein [Polyangiaceae bacterium]
MSTKLAAVLGLLLVSSIGCTSKATVSLRLDGNIDDASVTIDDQDLGSVSFVEKRGVALPIGQHRVTIKKTGFFPYDEIVDAKEGSAPIQLHVELEPIPD